MKNFLSFDWISWQTAVTTLGLTGVVVYFLRKAHRFIRRNSQQITDAFFRVLNRIASRSLRARLSMRQYCTNQLNDASSRYLYVPGFKGDSLDVDDVFVPLSLDLGGRELPFSSADFLRAGNRLLIIGDPGSGKSTLLKRVFRETCDDTRDAPTKGRLPVRLELKRFSPPTDLADDRQAGNWLFGEIREAVIQVEGFEIAQLFDTWAADTGLLILLDGLDEVASDNYLLMVASLRGLSRKLAGLSSKNQVVVSMRIQFHQRIRANIIDDYPLSLYVRPFTPNEIYTFLDQWPFEDNRDLYVNRIYEALTDRPTLRDMCSNPLVLAMYVESHYESSTADVPDTRTQFYEKVVNELLFRRRQRQEVFTGRSVGLRDQREAILGELAFQNLTDPSQSPNSLSWSTAVRVAVRTWKCDPAEAEIRLRELANETGLIAEEKPAETIRFIHLTFCEFLAAVECARGRRNGWETLLSVHRKFLGSGELQLQSRLIEVLPFAHALLPRVNRPVALSDIASLADRLVLGRCFLETQLYGESEWAIYLTDEQEYLANMGGDGWDDTLLRRLHLFSVVVRDARDWHYQIARISANELESVFIRIVGGSRSALAKVFVTYASQDAAAAIRLADDVGVDIASEYPGLAIESCKEKSFLVLALDKVSGGQEKIWSAIVVEAALRYRNIIWHVQAELPPTSVVPKITDKKLARGLYLSPVWSHSILSMLLAVVLADESVLPVMSATEALRIFALNSSLMYWTGRLNKPVRMGALLGSLASGGYVAYIILVRPAGLATAPMIIVMIISVLLLIIVTTLTSFDSIARMAYLSAFNFIPLPGTFRTSGWTVFVLRKLFPAQWIALSTLDSIRTGQAK